MTGVCELLFYTSAEPTPGGNEDLGEPVLEQSREQVVSWVFSGVAFPRQLSQNSFCLCKVPFGFYGVFLVSVTCRCS